MRFKSFFSPVDDDTSFGEKIHSKFPMEMRFKRIDNSKKNEQSKLRKTKNQSPS